MGARGFPSASELFGFALTVSRARLGGAPSAWDDRSIVTDITKATPIEPEIPTTHKVAQNEVADVCDPPQDSQVGQASWCR
jgi:hypothetical protein